MLAVRDARFRVKLNALMTESARKLPISSLLYERVRGLHRRWRPSRWPWAS